MHSDTIFSDRGKAAENGAFGGCSRRRYHIPDHSKEVTVSLVIDVLCYRPLH